MKMAIPHWINGSSESMRWMLDLELEHEVVATGTQIEGMKNQFITSKAAMIVDGPWNWATYEDSRLNIGQTLLPTVTETGERMSPLVTTKVGQLVSKVLTRLPRQNLLCGFLRFGSERICFRDLHHANAYKSRNGPRNTWR